MSPRAADRTRRKDDVAAVGLTVSLVWLAYLWIVSAGLWFNLPPTTDFYDRLAQAFSRGHTYLDVNEDASFKQLGALPDPYEPDARRSIPGFDYAAPPGLADSAYYDGRIYLYWGPAPAAFLALLKLATPRPSGDQTIALLAAAGLFLFEALILLHIRRRWFARLPLWTFVIGMIAIGFMIPVTTVLGNPRIYEAAVAAGQLFFVAGLYFAITAVDRDSESPSPWRLVLAGICWVLSVASRATTVLPIGFLSLLMLIWLWQQRTGRDTPSLLRNALPLLSPLIVGAILLGYYNFLRFGSPFEFGFRYELTFVNQNKYHNVLFSPAYLLPNAYVYVLNPPTFTSTFPFLSPEWNGQFVAYIDQRYNLIYSAERTIGLVYAAPFLVFALAPFATVAIRRRSRSKAPIGDRAESSSAAFQRYLPIALAGAAGLGILTILLAFYATLRYLLDFMPALGLLAVIGFWSGYQALAGEPRARRVYAGLGIALAVTTIVVGLLLIFSPAQRFRLYNPQLLPHIRHWFSPAPQ